MAIAGLEKQVARGKPGQVESELAGERSRCQAHDGLLADLNSQNEVWRHTVRHSGKEFSGPSPHVVADYAALVGITGGKHTVGIEDIGELSHQRLGILEA